jgi:hypothetical protein
MYEYFTGLWRKMEHHSLVIKRANKDLVLVPPVLEASWQPLLLGTTHLFGGGLLLLVLGSIHEHFQVLVENSRSNLYIREGLGCTFKVVESPLRKAGLVGARGDRAGGAAARLPRLRVERALQLASLDPISIVRGAMALHIGVQLDGLALVMPIFVKIQEVGIDTPLLRVANKHDIREGIIEKFAVAFRHAETDVFDHFSLLFGERNII